MTHSDHTNTVLSRRRLDRRRRLGAVLTLGLLAIPAVTAAAPYQLPLRGESLAADERFYTFLHEQNGIQNGGKDIAAKRRQSDGTWTMMRSGQTDTLKVENWIAYGKPFYAMAAGTVVGCWRNAPNNVPGSYNADYLNKKFDGNGNHLWILQDDGLYALYAHAKPGSIPSALCPHNDTLFTGFKDPDVVASSGPNIAKEAKVTNGVRVSAGQLLGAIGNSGATEDYPHLHVHMQQPGAPATMPFFAGLTAPFDDSTGKPTGPWTKLAGAIMPLETILFWPPNTPGNYHLIVPVADYNSQTDHLADSGLMPQTITCTGDGATYDAMWVPKAAEWVTFAGMSVAEAAFKNATLSGQGFTRTWSYSCGSKTVAIWRK